MNEHCTRIYGRINKLVFAISHLQILFGYSHQKSATWIRDPRVGDFLLRVLLRKFAWPNFARISTYFMAYS